MTDLGCGKPAKSDIPPFSQLISAYERDDPNKHLRLGQWFFNRFVRNAFMETRSPYNYDKLYNSTNFGEILGIIKDMYKDYQWPIR